MGGEKVFALKFPCFEVGSPPHGRGKAKAAELANGKLRITPAWAGKRNPARRSTLLPKDHPRMGGEKQNS